MSLLFAGVAYVVPRKELGPGAPTSGLAGGRGGVLVLLLPAVVKALKDFGTAAGHVSRVDVDVSGPREHGRGRG